MGSAAGAADAPRAFVTQILQPKLCPVECVRTGGVNKRETSQTGGPGRQRGGAGSKKLRIQMQYLDVDVQF